MGNKQKFYYTYVLRSEKDGKKYVGITRDVWRRIDQHNAGLAFSTRPRRPLQVIYFEACLDLEDARRRESYLKSTAGRRFLAKKLRHFLFA